MNTVGIVSLIVGLMTCVLSYQVPLQTSTGKEAIVKFNHELRQLGILLVTVGAIIVSLPFLGI